MDEGSSTNNQEERVSKDSALEQTRAQVEEVVDIMRLNIVKVMEREHKLPELENRAISLEEGGKIFEQQAQKLKRKYWWQNIKMMIILGLVIIVILIIIIGSQHPPKNNLLDQTRAQVDEVVGIMRVNVEKVLERDQKLSELDNRADALQEGGKRFEQQAQKLKRKYWWQNLKMMIILGIIGVVILIIIIVSIVNSTSSSDSTPAVTAAPAPSP